MISSALINVTVDPYGYFSQRRIVGFNALKPAAANRVRATKPVAIIRAHPRTVIIGNSRPEVGFDPESAQWPPTMRPVYNFAIPGDSLQAQAEYGAQALDTTAPATLIWAVDFLDFIEPWGAPTTASGDEEDVSSGRLGRSHTTLLALLSAQALTDSLWTLLAQTNPDSATRTALGFNPARDYIPIVAHQGAFILFEQKRQLLNDQLGRSRWRVFADGSNTSSQFAAFEHLLRRCVASKTRVIVAINPYHAEYMHIIDAHGYGGMVQEWKQALSRVVARYPRAELWDFSQPHAYLSEPPPPAASRQPLRWFWEPSHYRRELGEIMLARMLHPQAPDHASFGQRLTPSSPP